MPKQLVNEVLRSLHGEFEKHPGITRKKNAYRVNFHYPNIAQLIREWVISCEQYLRESRINPRLTRPHLQYPNEHITAPEDAMQIDLVPGLLPSGGYENNLTTVDVLSPLLKLKSNLGHYHVVLTTLKTSPDKKDLNLS